MILKYYNLLYPLVEFKYLVDQENDEDCNLDIFKMTTNTNKFAKELVKREFLIFRWYQMDLKDMKCCLQWWGNMSNVSYYWFSTYEVLKIVGSYIKTFFFSIIVILKHWLNEPKLIW